jgi:FkbH-like protein
MKEPIRLVIWDLDECFWSGTLSEGPITYSQANHDLVIELAKRGILNSIVSKNDLEHVRSIFVEKGLWEYFVFPSVNWDPKGPRIKAIIDACQLRPASVLFIDDNHLNRAEAQHFISDLSIASDEIIPQILENELFAGKKRPRSLETQAI